MAEISVIVPVYNQAAYLAQAIQSVCEQTFTNWELIVVDDGSTDDTREVLAKFRDSRVSVIRQANKGVSAARNTGIFLSSAPLVSFLDADDLLMPDMMTVPLRYLKDHPETGLVAGRRQKVDSSGRIYEEKATTPTCLGFPELLLGNDIPIGAVLVRREWLERVGGFDESMHTCEDWDLWLRLVLAGCQIARVEQVLVSYRIHPEQVTGNAAKMRTGTLRLWEKFFNVPNLPSNVLAYRNPAVASALIRTAARAFRSGEFEIGNSDLVEAIRLDPSLASAEHKRLGELLAGWATDPHTQDPESYLLAVSNHILELPGIRPQLRKAIAAAILGSLFGASKEVWRTKRKALIRAISYDPAWLSNRGVLRMIVDAWFPLPAKKAD